MAEELHSLPHILLVGDEQPHDELLHDELLHEEQPHGELLHDEPLHDEPLHEVQPQLHDELLQHEPGDRQDVQGGQGHGGGLSGHTESCIHSQVWCSRILEKEDLLLI